jgi:hypothetical protein
MIDDFEKLSVTELRLRGMTSDKILAEQKRRGMSKEQINDAWFPKPPTYNRIGSRRFRRRLVLFTYGGWFLLAAILLMTSATSPGSIRPIAVGPLLFIANAVVLGVWFARRTYLSREVLSTDAGLDERLVQNRNFAFRRAFQIFSLLVLLAWPLSLVVMAALPGDQGYNSAFVIYFAVALLAATLPTALWAWREPDPAEPENPSGPTARV